jgi:hypothetical protein
LRWRRTPQPPSLKAARQDTSTRYTLSDIELHPGDTLAIEGHPDGGEPSPIDYVELTPALARNE